MAPGFDHAALVKDLRKQVTALEDDLRVQSDEVERFATALRAEYDLARQAERTAATYGAWRDERVTQVAAAWVLGTVFVRFCEDNQLIEWPYIAGPGERLADAEERHEAFFRAHPSLNDRDWIIEAFNHLASTHPAVAGLFDRDHNPLWEIEPSFEAATELLRFWRRREGGYDFTDPSLDTRFLGDLYQDLSEHARKTYALLQTPEFVEEFILDLTLEPAVEEFGLKGLRTIDPACGSGHFLLGIFERLIAKWRAAEPGTDDWTLIRRSMESVHGCDKNPFAVSITRFRLLVAVVKSSGEAALVKVSEFPISIAVGDSLLHGRDAPGVQTSVEVRDGALTLSESHNYRTEDVNEYVRLNDLLGKRSYHVVVGNPPYINVNDKQERLNYKAYQTCYREYALSVPFAERLFHLAIRGDASGRGAGYVGQITSNSFMKREFGKRLVEWFSSTINLTHIVDTSGAYIPGHGTPTVILVGRNCYGRADRPIRTVLGVRGEPVQPDFPRDGLVWSAIVDQVDRCGSESEWVTVQDSDRSVFSRHPWSIGGGGAGDLKLLMEKGNKRLHTAIDEVGLSVITGEDSAYVAGSSRRFVENGIPLAFGVEGTDIRDWTLPRATWLISPYTDKWALKDSSSLTGLLRFLWPLRDVLYERKRFSVSLRDRGANWYEWREVYDGKLNSARLIAFPLVATHNHFYLETANVAHKHSASVIKLPKEATDDDHSALLGILNSSATCFWLKQVCHNKGNGADSRGARTTSFPWEDYYEFTGTKLREFPLPKKLPLDLGRTIDSAARQASRLESSMVAVEAVPSRVALSKVGDEFEALRRRMIALQEELDWTVYGSYGLLSGSDVAKLTVSDLSALPEVKLGERAFEIALARKVVAGTAEATWFVRHGSTLTAEIPIRWPEWYRKIVQERIDIIERRKDIALIERPEYKRRWATKPWDEQEAEALRKWLLDRCEQSDLWFARREGMKQPRTLTVSQLADQFKDDADMQSVAQLYATDHLKKRDLTLAQILEQVIADQHVPYLAAMRYKDSGLRKRQQWEETWELQREEDRTGKRLDIAVPPKYTSADFKKTSYWSQRGKLDVPKERFISYPDANPDSDPTLLLGWAGWDHKDQAQALVNIVNDRTDQAGWGTDKIQPLLAGLLEVMPWVKQWHGEYDDEWGGNPAEEYQAFLDGQRAKHQLTEDDLRGWRPAAATRGRKKG